MDRKKKIIVIIGVLISILCSWLFLRKIEWFHLKAAFREANYIYVIPMIIISLISYYVRAFRWSLLLSPVKKISVWKLFSATMIGFMANTVLPARGGEIIKPIIVAKKEKIRIATTFATVVIERIFDLLGIIFIASMVFLLLPSEMPTDVSGVIKELKKWSIIIGAFGMSAAMFLFLLAVYPRKVSAVFEKLIFFLPRPIKDKLVSLLHSFISGLQVFDNKKQLLWIGALSVIIWLLTAASIYVLRYSLNIELSYVGACFVIVCLALAVALPQSPGAIGVFHIATQKALEIFGVGLSSAQSYAIMLWALSVIPVAIVGLLFLWKEGISLGEISKYEDNIP